ncbi:RDD family protein [Cellulomonas persica]|uniref:FHA domain-containing protein n=1 Tax=Cellulomonas persica TaxID=76861 RepID=A0A510UW83_9CELL|nr:RDD family protein [Cellulomonas persica]GEK18947.1 hypothetical protein CPE01_26800 [Cellulomonas persica]
MSELTCGACGRPLREGARFCTGCGAPAAPMIVVEAQPPTRRTSARGGAGGGRSRRAPRPQTRSRAVAAPGRPSAQPGAAGASGAPGALGAAFDGVRTARVGARLGAFALDTLAVALAAAAVVAATRNAVLAALVAAELAIGLVVWEARTGRTVGNLLLGLRAAREESPYAPGLARSVSRALVLLGGHLVAGVGQWVVVGSVGADRGPLRQGWHDKAGRAVVVDVRGPRDTSGAGLAAHGAAVQAGARAGLQTDPTVRGAASVPVGAPVPVGAAVPSAAPVLTGVAGQGAVPTPGATPYGGGAAGSLSGGPVPGFASTPPHPPVPQAVTRPRTFVLTLDTGEAMSVSGPGVMGRAPRPRDGERCDHVVTIDDPQRSLSRTHARFGIDARGFWVADAGSGNGTVTVLPSGQSVVVEPERPTYVPSGSTIRLGDRTVLVEQLG